MVIVSPKHTHTHMRRHGSYQRKPYELASIHWFPAVEPRKTCECYPTTQNSDVLVSQPAVGGLALNAAFHDTDEANAVSHDLAEAAGCFRSLDMCENWP